MNQSLTAKRTCFIIAFCFLTSNLFSQILFSDSFNGASLNPNWIIANPNPSSKVQLNGNGELLIQGSPSNGGSDLCNCSNYNAPRLLQAIDTANHNWRVETKFRFAPANDYQGAGIIIYTSNNLNDNTALVRAIERKYFPIQGGQTIGSQFTEKFVSYSDTVSYFRLQRSIDSIKVWYSSDGIIWNNLDALAGVPVFYVGIFSIRQPWDAFCCDSYANFDYFNSLVDVLGLNLISFDAINEDKKVLLRWNTENESNLFSYTIERSSDGKDFYSIGNVVPANSGSAHSYYLSDASPLAGANFYRLKIMETDGNHSYSVIKKINFENNNSISIYPNPTTGKFTVDFGNSFDAKAHSIVILNSVLQKILTIKTNQQKIEVNLNSVISRGIYFLEIRNEKQENISSKKIIIK